MNGTRILKWAIVVALAASIAIHVIASPGLAVTITDASDGEIYFRSPFRHQPFCVFDVTPRSIRYHCVQP